MTVRRLFATAVVSILLAGPWSPARADEFKAAKAFYDNERFDEALRALRPLADGGDAKAAYLLGQIYFFGFGRTERNDGEAARWYRVAAEAQNLEAMYRLGYLYASGQGVPQSGELAAQLWTQAAGNGHRASTVALGDLYYEGIYTRADEKRARQWLHRAALTGDTESMYKLATNLFKSEIIPNDHRRAWAWFYIAAQRGHEGAKNFVARNQRFFAPHEIRRGEIWGRDYLQRRIPPPGAPGET